MNFIALILMFLIISANGDDLWFQQSMKCNDEVEKKREADINSCLSVVQILEKEKKLNKMEQDILAQMYLNIGAIYYYRDDKVNAYKFWKKVQTAGDPIASKSANSNIEVLCKQSPKICK